MSTTPTPGADRTRQERPQARRFASPIARMRVGTKLLLLAMLPACCVFALAAVSAVSDYRTADRLSTYRSQARLSFVLEGLAVDVDHERRAAALVRLDPGAASNALLAGYERATTQGFAEARARALNVPAPIDVVGDLAAAFRQRQALVLQLDAGSLAPAQAISGYSVIAQNVLGLTAALDGGALSPASARAATAYGAILQAIEAASRERVFVATLLAPRDRQPPTVDPWDGLQSVELSIFRQNAAGPLAGDLESVLFSPAGVAVQRFRDELAANPAAAVRSEPLQRWLSVTGTGIDALRGVAGAAGDRLDAVLTSELHGAHLSAVRNLGLSLVVLVLVTALALALRRSITGPLRDVSAAARGLAQGDIAARVDYSGQDEIGDVASAFGDVHATAARLVDEIRAGNRAVKEDRLEHRADMSGLDGVWSQLLAGTNDTMAAFGELRQEQRRVADEQSALRRVATLVAEGVAPSRLFGAVAKEAATVLPGVAVTVIGRYSTDYAVDFVGGWSRDGVPEWIGQRFPLGGENVSTRVFETNAPARVDTLHPDASSLGGLASRIGARSSAGAPINVEGKLWGVIVVASTDSDVLPHGIEHRVAAFTELVATAIANAEAREALRAVADEQAALRRLATLVAEAAPREEVYAAVTEEIARRQEADVVALLRYETDGTATVASGWAVEGTEIPVGTRLRVGGHGVAIDVLRTHRAAYVEHLHGPPGSVAAWLSGLGIRSGIGTPIVVEDELWGVVVAGSRRPEALPAGSEARTAEFTDLVATAIGNGEARAALRHVADEQAALRRVATLVAGAASPADVFAAVAEEVGQLMNADLVSVERYDPDGSVTIVAGRPETDANTTRMTLGGHNVTTQVYETGRPARIGEYAEVSGPVAAPALAWGVRCAIGAPITVEGRLWGLIYVGSRQERAIGPGDESRLAAFTELVATAIANAEARAELTASRARIVASADETRRKIERDLHDGAQQRLVTLTLQLRAAQAMLPAGHELTAELGQVVAGLSAALEELRELAGGIHPPVLAAGGLGAAVRTLGRRSPIPVEVEVDTDGRLPEPIEVGAYYVVAEALTNAAKHSEATSIGVDIQATDEVVRIRVQDDGVGGAEFARGSGLLGLRDRVEALGGRIALSSKPGDGTLLSVELPLASDRAAAVR